MKRLIFSILAGLITTTILSTATDQIFHATGIFPPPGKPFLDNGLVLIAFIYRAIFIIAGAYVTAVIAKEQAMKAVLILGIIGSTLWLIGAIMMWEFGPAWYNIGGVITGIPLSLIGGKLYERYKLKKII